jgi:hypothetical protein
MTFDDTVENVRRYYLDQGYDEIDANYHAECYRQKKSSGGTDFVAVLRERLAA